MVPIERAFGLKALRSRNKILKKDAKASAHTAQRTILGQSSELPIRARFAPSPTGYLHLGSLRTALFNCLAARVSNGAFILRVEDTDQNRLVGDAEDRLIKELKWAGLAWDEGPDCGGPYGPYKQSERLAIYKYHVQTLIDRGHAYRCFCTSEQLESQKRVLHEAGKSTSYPGTCRSVDSNESERRFGQGDRHVVRLKGDAFGRPKFRDAIYGLFQKKDVEEDFVLLKSDGFPTYHLANVVDDHMMKITHVIRGEEWLISTPKHLALYQAFGWKPPTFAHLGLLVNSDGSKLSKRNDSVNLSTYQAKGVLPMALLSWLANLGSSFKSNIKAPRTIAAIADAVCLKEHTASELLICADKGFLPQLTFKFTRGGIKLNIEKLDYFHAKYRDAILWDPIPELLEKESMLIDKHVIQPILQEINAITRGQGTFVDRLPEIWRREALIPVPAILNENSKARYMYNIVAGKRGGFLPTETLIKKHHYLFWRVPKSTYRLSLASYRPDQRILQALGDAVEQPELWTSEGVEVMQAIWAALDGQDIDSLAVHNTLRLVGAGGHSVVSQSSSRMFMLLGRDEWRWRTDMINKLLSKEQRKVAFKSITS
ncbi:Glutamate--tRNA ligase mitochondrial [Conoideocrella luteorostrata]|uniref:Glutamate--tRNA ligase, mitochondrial n=1 Tax=Conoideocrella luteorostrata TaxID=1105319 RepID=A0AAJ0CZ86_9HYPO|nr:Glutamate--tRNA ligase mitochondrial [Conoideocrella luteorostrata]